MSIAYEGQEKLVVLGDRYFKLCEQSEQAAYNVEWANTILAKPSVTYPNGRASHEVASEIREKAEDTLLDFWVLV